ncbi:MAG: hypothetical protein HQM02_00825 [Magnetococcales bacterium]|nr:hypothetical protein [Magnetococcales bacterium]
MLTSNETIDLFLFTADPVLARQARNATITTLVIDWECRDKHLRQNHSNTEINQDTPEALAGLAASVPDARRVCRINAFHPQTRQEIEIAIAKGATHLLLPMVRRLEEAQQFLEWIARRVPAGILIETMEACALAEPLSRLPLDLVYIGLNDLAISRRTPNLFTPLADGLVDRLRQTFATIPFGVGGLTRVDGGHPLPCALLMTEYARLNCTFSFLRRSFKRDVGSQEMRPAVEEIQRWWRQLRNRSPAETAKDRQRFLATMEAIDPRSFDFFPADRKGCALSP